MKDIRPNQELLVWYGEDYAKDLGLYVCDTSESETDSDSSDCESDVASTVLSSGNFLKFKEWNVLTNILCLV